MGYLGRLAEVTGGTLVNIPHDVVANDEHALGLLEFSAEREGKHLQERAVHIAHVRDGRIAEVWFFWEDQRVVDDFFS